MSKQEHPLFTYSFYTFLFNSYKNPPERRHAEDYRLKHEAAADVDEGWYIGDDTLYIEDDTRQKSLLKWRILMVLFLSMAAAAAYFSIMIK